MRRLLRHVGVAEVAAHQAADPVARTASTIGWSRPSSRSIFAFVGRIDEAGGVEQDVGDVAGHQPQHDEDQHRHAEQRHAASAAAADEIGSHVLDSSLSRLSDRAQRYLSSHTSSKRQLL